MMPMASHIQATAGRAGKHQSANAGQLLQAPEKVRSLPVTKHGEPAQARCIAFRSSAAMTGAASGQRPAALGWSGKHESANAEQLRQAWVKMRSPPVAMQGEAGVVLAAVSDGGSIFQPSEGAERVGGPWFNEGLPWAWLSVTRRRVTATCNVSPRRGRLSR